MSQDKLAVICHEVGCYEVASSKSYNTHAFTEWLINQGWGLSDDMKSWMCPEHFTLLP